MANTKAAASRRGNKRPPTRMPWEREECSIWFDPDDGRTHQSFRDECDVNKILDLHVRTGLVNHLNQGKPQYGEVPSQTLFETALIQAEIRSAVEEGWEPPADDIAPEGVEVSPEPEPAPAASEAASGTKEGDRSGE